MQELIKISPSSIGDEVQQTVNARELWVALKSGRQFGNWIQDKLEDGPWQEGVHYLINRFVKQTPSGGKHTVDYHISLDMAKHIAMMEKSEPGYLARDYFIECERQAIAAQQPLRQLPKTFAQALRLAADLEEQKLLLEQKIEEDAPKVVGYQQSIDAEGAFSRRDCAKNLKVRQQEFNKRLIEIGHWTKDSEKDGDKRSSMPTQVAIDAGYAIVKRTVKYGTTLNRPLITPRGEDSYRRRINRGEWDDILTDEHPRSIQTA